MRSSLPRPPQPPASVGWCPPHGAHTVTRPAGWAAPATARVEPRALPGTNLSRRVRGSALRVHEAREPAPVAALAPTRRSDSSWFEFTTARPGLRTPPPRRFPAPRDYRSCRGSVSGSGRRPRSEGGREERVRTGSVARKVGPSLPPAPPRGPGWGRPPGARLRCHGDHSPAIPERARLKFPDPLSPRRTRVPARPRGWTCHSARPGLGLGLVGFLKAPSSPEPFQRALPPPPPPPRPSLSGRLDLGRAAAPPRGLSRADNHP